MYTTVQLAESRFDELLLIPESFFIDVKCKRIQPAKLSQTISAFANASGGEIYIGISEDTRTKTRGWDGFNSIEDANAFVQTISGLAPLENFYSITFLKHPTQESYIIQITVMKTTSIVQSTNNKAYVRHGAQNLPTDTPEKVRRLELDKGVIHFENEMISDSMTIDAVESEVFDFFAKSTVPNVDKYSWITKQNLCRDNHLNVAGTLLFTDEPQVFLPKRSSIKIYRYKTSGEADRDMLDGNPITIEGAAYFQIYKAVEKVKEIIEKIRRIGVGFEAIEYPNETLHEIITNAVLHRDYSIATDIQIRIFDNRVEVESPGKLPGYVTVQNILESQAARNPKVVRIINKFPNAPNKDVGEGLNTAFNAMTKLRLKVPLIEETDASVLVTIKHEKLASPEEIVIEHLLKHDKIRNREGREVTGIKSENTMKNVFYKLRDRGFIKLVKGFNYWTKTENFNLLVKEQFGKRSTD